MLEMFFMGVVAPERPQFRLRVTLTRASTTMGLTPLPSLQVGLCEASSKVGES